MSEERFVFLTIPAEDDFDQIFHITMTQGGDKPTCSATLKSKDSDRSGKPIPNETFEPLVCEEKI